jgi:O-antigen/teichoic acid export membrane protein
LISAQILSALGSIILVKVITVNLSPTDFGAFGLGMSVIAIFNGVIVPAVLAATSRYYSVALDSDELNQYLRSINEIIKYFFIFILCILSFSISFLYVNGFQKWIYLNILIWTFSFLNGVSVVFAGIQNSARNRIQFMALYALDSWFRIGCCLLVFHLLSANATTLGLSYLVSSAILVGIQLILFNQCFSHKRVLLQKKWVIRLFNYGLPFFVVGFFFWIELNIGKWLLEGFSTRESIGFFVILIQLGFSSTQIVVTMLLNIINPIFIYKGKSFRSPQDFDNVKKLYSVL